MVPSKEIILLELLNLNQKNCPLEMCKSLVLINSFEV